MLRFWGLGLQQMNLGEGGHDSTHSNIPPLSFQLAQIPPGIFKILILSSAPPPTYLISLHIFLYDGNL